MAIPCNPLPRAAAIIASGLETPSPEKKECVCRSILKGIARGYVICSPRSLHEFFNKNACFCCAFLLSTIELVIVQPPIVAGFLEQLGVRADLLDAATIHHDDLIGGQ